MSLASLESTLNSAFDARSFSLTGQDTPKPGYNRMQGLASFGGPLKIPRLLDRNGQIHDTQYQLVAREDAYAVRESRGFYGVAPNPFGYGGYEQRPAYYYYDNNGRYVPAPRDAWRPPQQYYGQYGPYGRDPRFQAPPPRDPYGREYQTPQRIDPGFDTNNLAMLSFDLGALNYDPPRAREFERRALETVQHQPGIRAATLASNIPPVSPTSSMV